MLINVTLTPIIMTPIIKGFNDEPLQGKWKGHRSSRLNIQYRIIYKLDGEQLLVQVVKVTLHDYRRK